jgi:hypothetical protein
MIQPSIHPRTKTTALSGHFRPLLSNPGAGRGATFDLLAAPFEALRFQYASAVAAGLAQRSLLASGRLEQVIDRLERLILGPLARQR